ncbi:DUF2382 domain-containing protein [Erwinia oleae]|uniref:DUF2382 domain-containing protein n=1 Tax=Erwinia oleae TaxID=796334 RepID=UPI000689C9FC|nr:DUF2382 domain-containing protein [Erwinia oleae]
MRNKNAPPVGSIKTEQSMPLSEEQVEISTERQVDGKVTLTRSTRYAEELVQTELNRDEVQIKHIAINEPVADDYSAVPRQEGDVLIIPVIEEQVEIIRRRIIKEEIHIIKRRTTETFKQNVTLRHQEVKIEKT